MEGAVAEAHQGMHHVCCRLLSSTLCCRKLWWLTGVNLRDCLTHCHAWRMLNPVVSKSVPDLTERYVPGLLTLHTGYDMAS